MCIVYIVQCKMKGLQFIWVAGPNGHICTLYSKVSAVQNSVLPIPMCTCVHRVVLCLLYNWVCCLAHIYLHCTVQCLLYKWVYRLACMCTCVHCTVLSLLYRLAHMWPAVVGGAGHCLQQESFQQYCSTAQPTVVNKSSNTLQHSQANCGPVHKRSKTQWSGAQTAQWSPIETAQYRFQSLLRTAPWNSEYQGNPNNYLKCNQVKPTIQQTNQVQWRLSQCNIMKCNPV